MEFLSLAMFAVLFIFILSGFPVAFCLSGVGLLFAYLGMLSGDIAFSDFQSIPTRIFGLMKNVTLMAVPLFIFMGLILEKSKLADELLSTMAHLLKKWKMGLAFSIIFVGALLAASTGIVGATVVTMGVISLPAMLKKNHTPELASGIIVASGTLGQIIPPSIVLILLGDIMSVDVGSLFAGAILPGFMLVGGYLVYVFIKIKWGAEEIKINVQEDAVSWKKTLGIFLPPVALIVLVLGSILKGIASPTEAAGCGAFGAMLITALRRKLNKKLILEVSQDTLKMSCMVFMILFGSLFFSLSFRLLGGDQVIVSLIETLGFGKSMAIFFMMLLIFVLGFFLDFLEICFIVIPIALEVLREVGVHNSEELLWIGILIAINLQTSFLTPPFGFALFYLKGAATKELSTLSIYRGVVPFVAIQMMVLTLIAMYPEIVTWLPKKIFGVI